MTETDIEKRLEHAANLARDSGFCNHAPLMCDAFYEITRLRKRISELEYRERSRECVKGIETFRVGKTFVKPTYAPDELVPLYAGGGETHPLSHEDALDKIDGLEADLDSALDVLWRRGDEEGRVWVRLNYPKFGRLRDLMGPEPPPEHCPHCDTAGRCTHVCGWKEDARPDAVKILREEEEEHLSRSDALRDMDDQWGAYESSSIGFALRFVADALEKERKG